MIFRLKIAENFKKNQYFPGRQLFLRDATLNLSDVTLIGAQDEVEIDESLFDNEVSGKNH